MGREVALLALCAAGLLATSRALPAAAPPGVSCPQDRPGSTHCGLSCETCHIPTGDLGTPSASGSWPQYEDLPARAWAGADLDAASLLCLSCHDGSVASTTTSSDAVGTTSRTAINAWGDGTGEHPVGVRYPGFGGTGTSWSPRRGWKAPPLAGSSTHGVRLVELPDGSQGVGCTSCHDSHDNGQGNYLRAGGHACLSCHDV